MLALDPKYKLRRAKTNILFYCFDHELMDLANQKALHPNAAILLSFFNGANELETIKGVAQNLFELHGAQLEKTFNDFLKEWQPFLIESSGKIRNDNPQEFLIMADQVNQGEIICETPLYIGLNITQKCGRDCIYCYAERENIRKYKYMSFEQISKIVQQIIDLKMEFVILSGGDPFIRSDVYEIIKALSCAGIPIQLSTKQFFDTKMIAKLIKTGINKIQISIDCIDDDLSEKIIGVPHYSSNAFKTINLLQNSDITVTTNTVVTGYNFNEVPELVERLALMGIPIIRLSQYYRSAYNHHDRLFISENQAMKLLEFVIEFNKNNNNTIVTFGNALIDKSKTFQERMDAFLGRAMCSTGRMSFLIMPNGKVIPCEQLPCRDEFIIGDATKQSLIEIWNSQKMRDCVKPQKDRFRNTLCFECNHFEDCILTKGMCMRDSWKAYNTPYQIQPLCPKADNVQGRRLA